MNRILFLLLFTIAIFYSEKSSSQVRIVNSTIESCIPPWDVSYRWDIIKSQKWSGDTLILELGIKEDCSSFGPPCGFFAIEEKQNSLFLSYEYDTVKYTKEGLLKEQCPTSCWCFFNVKFKIIPDSKLIRTVYYEDTNLTEREGIYKPRQQKDYEIYLGDTINVRDQFGIKRGLWLEKMPDGQILTEFIYYEGLEYGNIKCFNDEDKMVTCMVLFKSIIISRKEKNDGYLINKKELPEVDRVEFVRNDTGLLESVRVTYKNGIENLIK